MKYLLKRACLLLVFAVMFVAPIFAEGQTKMQVTFLDCHQGDCIIIRTNEKTIMIDAGDDNRNVAQAYIIPYFKKEGIKKIDQAIISHPHRDHFGGFAELVKQFKFGEFVYSNDTNISSEGGKTSNDALFYKQLVELLQKKNIPYRRAKVGELLDWGKDVKAEVVFTDDGSFGDIAQKNANEMSIIIKATCGKISYLFTGDAEKKAEGVAIERMGKKLNATVLKSGHHGSKTSSSHAFMDMVQPKYGVIQCGKGNSFGHPTQQTLDIYDYYKMTVFRTDNDGTVESYTDGETVRFSSNKSPLQITDNPKVISITPNTATIQWETNRPAASKVEVIEKVPVRASNTPPGTSKGHDHLTKVHTITLTGLKPATDYGYTAISLDPRETGKIAKIGGAFKTPAGDGTALPKFAALNPSSKNVYMKQEFKVTVQVKNPADKESANTIAELYHSAMDSSNLITKSEFGKMAAGALLEVKVPVTIDWLGNVELIAVLKQGKTIIDTKSINVDVEPRKVVVDCAHGNKEYFMGKFAGIKMDLFQNLGLQMNSVSKQLNYNAIKDAVVYVIPQPTMAYVDSEIAALKQYVSKGGSVVMVCGSDYQDKSKPALLNKITKALGGKVYFNDDQVCDPNDKIGAPWKFFIKNFPAKDIVGSNVTKLLTSSPCSLVTSDSKPLAGNQSTHILACGDDNTYSIDGDNKNDALFLYATSTTKVPVPMVAAEEIAGGKIAYFGEAFYRDNYYSNPAGLSTVPFNRNVFKWLTAPKKASVKKIARSIAALSSEPDFEVRADKYDALTTALIRGIRVSGNRAEAIDEAKSELSRYSGETVDSALQKLDEVATFDFVHGND